MKTGREFAKKRAQKIWRDKYLERRNLASASEEAIVIEPPVAEVKKHKFKRRPEDA